jgi:beta-lactamase family protein
VKRKLALFLCLCVSTISAAQATIPDTPAGRLWQQWLEIFNAGDVPKLTEFIARHFSEKMLDGRTPAAEARREMNLRDRMGNFEVFRVESSSPNDLKLLVRTDDGLSWKKDAVKSLKDYVPFFANQPLRFEPGKGWAYSNGGMIVAGLIVEKVS